MKRVVALALLTALVAALLCLGASETPTNRSGKTAACPDTQQTAAVTRCRRVEILTGREGAWAN